MVAGTASAEYDAAAATDSREVCSKTTECDLVGIKVDAATHGVDDRVGLLVDLLLHEVVELAFHDLGKLELESLDATRRGNGVAVVAAETVNVEFALCDVCDVVVLEV